MRGGRVYIIPKGGNIQAMSHTLRGGRVMLFQKVIIIKKQVQCNILGLMCASCVVHHCSDLSLVQHPVSLQNLCDLLEG